MENKPEWQQQAEKLAELYGTSFVIFRNGMEPECQDPAKIYFGFHNEVISEKDDIRKRLINHRQEFKEEIELGARMTKHRFSIGNLKD